MKRIAKEKEVIRLMIGLYCSKKHQSTGLCADCRELMNYADKRLSACKYQEEKMSCKKCPIHCYNNEMKVKIKKVMRYSGPKVLIYKPCEFLRHIFK